ncbi:MAG: hypothetical protein GY772_12875 [bacterium]|nr:hypothetical protein [bacterium]
MSTRALTLGIAVVLLGQPAIADLWMWTDPEGVVRYTSDLSRIPSAQRTTALAVTLGMTLPSAPPETAGTESEAPALFAPPDEVFLAPDPFNAPEQARSLAVDDVAEPESGDPWEAPTEQKPSADTAATTADTGAPAGFEAPAPASAMAPTAPASAMAPTAPGSRAALEPKPERSAASTATAAGAPAAAAPSTATAAGAPTAAAPSTATAAAVPTPTVSATPRAAAPAPAASTSDPERRRAELQQMIDRDRDTLKALISNADATDIEDSPELREIARRLPRLQAELRALERDESTPKEVVQ